MSKVMLLCGKVCSGKSYFAQELKLKHNAVILSVDEITLAIADDIPNEKHDNVAEKVQKYLFEKSVEIINCGIDVILDWGFWRKTHRTAAKEFYINHNIDCELYYITTSDEKLKQNISMRNKAVIDGKISAYYVDSGLAKKCNNAFEVPNDNEYDFLIYNN